MVKLIFVLLASGAPFHSSQPAEVIFKIKHPDIVTCLKEEKRFDRSRRAFEAETGYIVVESYCTEDDPDNPRITPVSHDTTNM